MIKFSCKKCGQNLNVEDKHSGKRIKCPKCGSVGVVPGNSDKIKFNCKNCGQSISVPQIHAGKKGKCPKCKNLVVIPSVKKELSDDTETFSITCSICDETIQVSETSRGQTIECPACGSYIEISPGGTMGGFDSSIPPTTDEDSYEEDSGEYKESEGVDKSIIVGISAVAAVLVVVLIVLAVVLRLIVSRPAKRPEALRRQQQVVDADSLPRMVASDTQSTEPVVQERMKENISPTEPISLEGNLENTKIAFVEKINGLNDEIYVMNPDGSEQRNLTNNPAYDRSPSWSPDGKKIAFSRGSEIYVINTDGSGLKNLTNSPDIDSNPSWSPDGKKIAFYSLIRGGNWNRSWMEQNCEIYVMNADGSEKKNLTNNPARDWDPFWSPDGKKIAFRTIAQGNQEIYVMNADGSEQKRLTNHPGNKAISCWSPDGKKILFYTFGDGHYKMIYIVNIDEGESKRLTNSSAEESDPSFSPDGTKIVFVSWRDGNSEIYVMNADGSEQKRLTTDKYPAFPLDVHSPSWSPDGRKIVFCSERGVGQSNIFVMNADGSEQKSLTYGIDLDLEPVWSPFMSSTAKGESKEEDTPLTELVIQEQSPKPDSLGGEPRVRLRQMFLPGKYRLEVIQTMTVKGILTAESSRVKTSESQEKWWYDIDASEPDASGQTTCIATFKRIISSDSEGSSYDTDDPYSLSPYDFEQIIRKIMVNKQYIFKLGQDGSIVSVEGLDRLWDSISNEVSREVAKVDPMNTRRAAQVGRQVVQQLKQEADALGDKGYIKSLFELVYDILPDQPVGVGAVWHKVTSENIPLFGAAEHSAEFTLREIEQNGGTRIAHITCVGSIRQEQSKKTQLGPVSMTINNAHSKRKGEIQLNVDTGLMIRSRDEFDGVMEASMIISGKNVDADAQMSFMTETTTKPVINDSESRESVPEPILQEPAKESTSPIEPIVK